MQMPNGDGERDVACIYALVMVHAYELSNDKRYLEEAEKAAESKDKLKKEELRVKSPLWRGFKSPHSKFLSGTLGVYFFVKNLS